MTRALVPALMLALLVAPSAHGRALGRAEASATLLAAVQCPALFGANAQRLANEQARRRAIYWVQEEAEGITVAHSSESWGEPVEIWVKGLHVLGVSGDAQPRAVVRVAPAVAALVGCPAADYALGIDDHLGRGVRILVVARAGLLLERASGLAYVRAPSASPCWVMAWSAPGKVRVGEGSANPYERIQLRSRSYDE